MRERLVSQRTGIINQIRAFLLERGIAVRQGQRVLRAELPRILATPPDVLSPRMVRVIEDLAGDWRRLDERIEGYRVRSRQLPPGRRLRAADERAGDRTDHLQRDGGRNWRWRCLTNGRDFAAWLGLVRSRCRPGTARSWARYLGAAIATCGFCSCRQPGCADQADDLGAPWAQAVDRGSQEAAAHNVLAIALANKLARIAWSVLARGRIFEVRKMDEAANQSA